MIKSLLHFFSNRFIEEVTQSPVSLTINQVDPKCPDGLSFYQFQKEGIVFARDKSSVLIADEMGLGKTPQAIGILNDNPSFQNVLIVCPSILKINWERELDVWMLNRDLSVSIAGNIMPQTNIVIANYERLAKVNILSREWDLVIIDEAHYMKNEFAKRTREIMGFRTKQRLTAKKIVLLTGTPMVNRPLDMWTICNYLAPHIFQNKWAYMNRYCLHPDPRKHRKYGRWDFTQSNNQKELADKLSAFMIRRFKRDVMPQLPAKQYSVIEIKPVGVANTLIRQEKEMTEFIEDSQTIRIKKESVSTIREQLGREKLPYVLNYLDDILETYDGKIVVFAHHRSVLEGLKEHFQNRATLVYGGMNEDEKQRQIDLFMNDPRVKVFVGSISAAGVGITLTNASELFFAEMDYVPAKMRQAEDRVHRATQKADSVGIKYLVFKDSLDANMAWSLTQKERVIDQVVGL